MDAEPASPWVQAVETHTGVVVFLGDRAYKLKKPLDLGFVDYSTRAARARACEVEVELNRRLAPDVYLGVGGLTDPAATEPEPLVVMRRLPTDRRLSALVARGDGVEEQVHDLADLIARFHERCPVTDVARAAATPEATRARWEDNHRGLEPYLPGLAQQEGEDAAPPGGPRAPLDVLAGSVVARARRYLAGRRPLLQSRIDDGWAREGHGDLLADDVFCLDDGPRVLDCLEFDPALRQGDVLADVAFLAMDLERLGRPDLGWDLLTTHRDLLGDGWPRTLAHHHVAYRAQVRAKVAAIRAAQGDAASVAAVRQLLSISDAHLRDGTVRAVLVGGLPGTGKSTLATAIGDTLGAVVLRTDEVRKEQAGLAATEGAAAPVDAGLYRPERVTAAYDEVRHRAGALLAHGESVVLDASWSDAGERERTRVAAEDAGALVVELRCVVPAEVARERIAARTRAGDDPSDATAAVYDALAARADPWPEAHAVATDTTPEASAEAAVALVRAADDAP